MTDLISLNDGFLAFSDKPAPVVSGTLPPWKILVVDDDDQVHAVTRLVLRHSQFRKRPFKLISAMSAREAIDIIPQHPDLALALVDVVMETRTAGLDLVRHIRDELKNRSIRLIMRTGQPGHAPEQSVVIDYEIDAYMAKTDISAQKLTTTIVASLRSFEYITEIQKLNAELEARVAMRTAELEKLAMLDPLTGAGNRRHLNERGAAEVAVCEREKRPLSVIMLDLDHFKLVNDTWGHPLGDMVLQEVVKTAKDLLRPSDFLARIGGEEFVVLLPSAPAEGAMIIAERIRAAIAGLLFPVEDANVPVTASFGVAELGGDLNLEAALGRADVALYQAKQSGRNQVMQAQENKK
jgi:diguanylate cyclase (GGDEF)-like protein